MKDAVCGMDVKGGEKKSNYKDKTYFFCSDNCKLEFDKNPGKYVQ